MGKSGKWIKNLLTGKKVEKVKCSIQESTCATTLVGAANPTTPISNWPTTPKEKRRWSFRRSSANNNMSGPMNLNSTEAVSGASTLPPAVPIVDPKTEAELSVTHISKVANERFNPYEQAAAIMIQSTFRCYLARKALRALRALVKLQALVRGHLVRKQAKATLRCMQALLTVQARVRAQRIQMAGDRKHHDPRQSPHGRGQQGSRSRHSYNDEDAKIVEMDIVESRESTKSRKSYSTHSQVDQAENRYSSYHPPYSKRGDSEVSPVPSAMTEMSPQVCSGHFDDYPFNTAQSSPQYQYHSSATKSEMSPVPFTFHQPEYTESFNYDYSMFPNYMANTQSSRAKARSQSAPKCRPESYERQPSRRRPSIEGRIVPRGTKMQRSSSQVGAAVQGYNYPPWAVRLDQSSVSLKASECGSTSTVLTTNTYWRSVAGYDLGRYKEYISPQL